MKIRIPFFVLSFLFSSLFFAQVPEVKWTYDLGAPAFGSAATEDLDNDGFYEIVFTTYTNDGKAHCINAEDGSMKWTFDIGGCGDAAPIIEDMNGDGQLDVVVNGSCNPTIFCIDGNTGELIWSKPSGGGDSPPTVADIDQDGKMEVAFGNFNGQLRFLNGEDGSTAKTIQANPFGSAVQTEVTMVDIDGDGQLEAIAANFFNDDGLHVWAFDYETTEIIWTNSVLNATSDFHAYHGGAVADLDNDGLAEYVIGSNNGDIRAINLEDGSDLWTVNVPGSNMSAVSVADLDNDGVIEVIFNNSDPYTFDNRIRVLSGMTGEAEWSYPITFPSFRGFSISDINGNGNLDLVSGHFMGMLRVVEPYSGLLWEKNLMAEFVEQDEFPWFETDHQPLIADFDQDGKMDVFAVGGYGTYIPDALNTGRAFLIEAGAGTCPEWLMFRHDTRRYAYLSSEEIEIACLTTNIEEVIPGASLTISPNPSTGFIQVDYDIPKQSKISISIFDAAGRIVDNILKETMLSGQGVLTWDGSNQASGIYFLNVQTNGNFSSSKIVLIE